VAAAAAAIEAEAAATAAAGNRDAVYTQLLAGTSALRVAVLERTADLDPAHLPAMLLPDALRARGGPGGRLALTPLIDPDDAGRAAAVTAAVAMVPGLADLSLHGPTPLSAFVVLCGAFSQLTGLTRLELKPTWAGSKEVCRDSAESCMKVVAGLGARSRKHAPGRLAVALAALPPTLECLHICQWTPVATACFTRLRSLALGIPNASDAGAIVLTSDGVAALSTLTGLTALSLRGCAYVATRSQPGEQRGVVQSALAMCMR
jgi:hypothetical protein